MTGLPIKLYLDEHVWRELTRRLQDQGYDALHVYDADRGGWSDEIQPGELLRRVLKLLETVSAEQMHNTVRYLQEFK